MSGAMAMKYIYIIVAVGSTIFSMVQGELSIQEKLDKTWNIIPDTSVACKQRVINQCLPGVYGKNVTAPPIDVRKRICAQYGSVETFSVCIEKICTVREQFVLLETACDFQTYDTLQSAATELTTNCQNHWESCMNTVKSFHHLFAVAEKYCAAMKDSDGLMCLQQNCTDLEDIKRLEAMETYACAKVDAGCFLFPGLVTTLLPVLVFIHTKMGED